MNDLHEKWPHRWLNKKVRPQKASEIEGIGIIAIEKVTKGEIVMIPGGVVVPIEDINLYKQDMGQVGIQIDDNFFLAPTSRKEVSKSGAINHSCSPNLGIDGSVLVRAIRDIEAGEECVIDYAFSYTQLDSFNCNCKSSNCRGVITGNDWQLKDLQQKYKDYFANFIKKKFL